MTSIGSVFVRRLSAVIALASIFAVGALQQSASAATTHPAGVIQSCHNWD